MQSNAIIAVVVSFVVILQFLLLLLLTSSPHLWLPVEPDVDIIYNATFCNFDLTVDCTACDFWLQPVCPNATVSKHTKYTFPSTKYTFPKTNRLLEISNPPSGLSVPSVSPTASLGDYTIHPPWALVAMMFVRIWNNLFMLHHYHNDDYDDC